MADVETQLNLLMAEMVALQSKVRKLEKGISAQGTSDDWPAIQVFGNNNITLDYCIIGNQKVTIPERTTDFLQILFGSSPSASWVAAMPETQPSNGVVIDVTKNRLYFTGEFGNG